jgi:hypothetical protein
MNTSELSLVPLRQASPCLDCEMITASQNPLFRVRLSGANELGQNAKRESIL